jgi:hypothetical protein
MPGMAEFWFNTRTRQVEQLEGKSQSKDLLGPYPTREQAEQALATASERTESWERADRDWERGAD